MDTAGPKNRRFTYKERSLPNLNPMLRTIIGECKNGNIPLPTKIQEVFNLHKSKNIKKIIYYAY